MKTLRKTRVGAAAIEFALCLPVFCALVFGIGEYGWLFFQQANVIAAVRTGVRYAVTLPATGTPLPGDAAVDRVKLTLRGFGYTDSQLDDITYTTDGTTPTVMLTVTAHVAYQPIIGIIPTPGSIFGQMTMLLEQP